VAFYVQDTQEEVDFDRYEMLVYETELIKIAHTWDIFQKNDDVLRADFDILTEGRISQPIPKSNNVIAPENVFIEEGAKLEFVTLNASTGPIYIGKDAEIMEGSVIRGPFALCEHAQVKLGTKIYGATTVGPHSRVGGEINNSVIFGYSNKGHDGFLGNSVLGEWCNLGADTNNSNLKNNYAPVKLWNYELNEYENTGLQFCGLMMGDHSKSGINTMFNTGTVVGVSSSIFGGGFPATFLPSFTWGGIDSSEVYNVDKAIETMKIVMSRRSVDLTPEDEDIIRYLAEIE
jgi:UDP-N-acetylglucosamine diphosphorylase/glucosamine-1-phosphate N-acetyltransferase